MAGRRAIPVPRRPPSVKNVFAQVRPANVCGFFPPSLANRPPDRPFKHLTGHFTYECKATRPYVSRPSRTAQLENPRVLAKLKADGKPSVDVPEEFKNKFVLCLFFFLSFSWSRVCLIVRCLDYRSGTADRILEAKEKEREKETTDRAKKRMKRYAFF
jgi:hypothetical protein